MADRNPYSPPATPVDAPHPQLPEARWPELDIRVVECRRTWYTRELDLTGSITTTLHYGAAGAGERLLADGQIVGTTSLVGLDALAWLNAVSERLDFALPWRGLEVPGYIEVYAPFLLLGRIKRFRVTLAGQLIYAEPEDETA